ncbi:hypothetical protein ACFZC7_14475, partial [Streptomyces massasporeus]|uniref:hypothetical protein n=1 Tax=Streptomyces massasporeus TaxID=67324 RepID=UPI0036E2D615
MPGRRDSVARLRSVKGLPAVAGRRDLGAVGGRVNGSRLSGVAVALAPSSHGFVIGPVVPGRRGSGGRLRSVKGLPAVAGRRDLGAVGGRVNGSRLSG